MEFDSFFGTPRWKILEIISKNPSSPIEIAEKVDTSIAYVSQQLKLLEAANLVIKTKTGSSEKGKPRLVYGLSKELSYVTSLTHDFSYKRMILITEYHKRILNFWRIKDPSLHYYLDKLYNFLEEDLEDIEKVIVEESVESQPKILIVTEIKKIKTKLMGFFNNLDKKILWEVIPSEIFKKTDFQNKVQIYPVQIFLKENKKLKGGLKKDEV